MATLIFIDCAEQVPLIGRAEPDSSARVIVAMRPQAEAALAQAGYAYRLVEEFYDHRRLRSYDDDFKYPKLEAFCHASDAALAQASGRPSSFQPLHWHYYFLTFVWDNAVMTLAQGDAWIKAVKPSRLVCFRAPHEPATELPFSERESLAGRLIPEVAKHHGVPATIIDYLPKFTPARRQVARRPRGGAARRAIDFGRRAAAIMLGRRRAGRVPERLREPAPEALTEAGQPNSVLMLYELCPATLLAKNTETWVWGGFDAEIVRLPQNRRYIAPSPTTTPRLPQDAIAAALAVPELAAACRFESIDWTRFAREHLAEVLPTFLHEIADQFERALAAVKTLRPAAIVASNLASPFQKSVAVAGRSLGIPVICSHHGQLGDQIEMGWGYIELPFCTHYLVHAPAAERHIDEVLRYRAPLQTIVTGNPFIEKVRTPRPGKCLVCSDYGLDPAKPLAVYVTIYPHGDRNRLAYTDTDNTMFANNRKICGALLTRPDLQIVVKGLASGGGREQPLAGWVAERGLRRLCFVDDRPFSDFLDAADLIVVDYPGLTLMECLTRKSALYVCNDSYRWIDAAVELLREEIVFEHDIDVFCARLRTDLQSGAALKPRQDDSVFLRRYGDPFADNATALRVADAVAEIAQGRC